MGNRIESIYVERCKEMKLSWYNYKTKTFDEIECPADFTDYIPQTDAAQGLYKALIEMGRTPLSAARYVFEAITGKEHLEPIEKD